jgi:hypothetical protein
LKQLWASAREPTSELRIPAEFLFSQRETQNKTQRRNITGEERERERGQGEHEASEQGCPAVATVARNTKRL